MTHIESRELVFYADGEVTPMRSSDIGEHLGKCSHCNDIFEEHQTIMGALHETDESLLGIDLVADVMTAIEQEEETQGGAIVTEGNLIRPPKGFWSRTAPAVMLAAAAAIAGILIVPQVTQTPEELPGFRMKSDSTPVPGKSRLVGISAYRLGSEGNPVYLGETMKAEEPLLFSYANASKKGYQYLMIFAVDVRGESHWYYPAYLSEDANLKSVPIQAGKTGIELSEQITHSLPSGALTIYGVFSKEPLAVSAMEDVVKSAVTSVKWKSGEPMDLALVGEVEVHVLQTRIE